MKLKNVLRKVIPLRTSTFIYHYNQLQKRLIEINNGIIAIRDLSICMNQIDERSRIQELMLADLRYELGLTQKKIDDLQTAVRSIEATSGNHH